MTALETHLKSIRLLRERIESWRAYPFTVPCIRNLDALHIKGRVTFFVGENGTGKSTLLEAIALHCGFAPEGGSRNMGMRSAEASQAVEPLSHALRLSWSKRATKGFFLRAESFFNFATILDDAPDLLEPYGGRSLHGQSHGESFLALVANRFFRKGLYLMDEPEAALSPHRQLTLLRIIHDLLKANNQIQFFIATHSPILLAYPGAQVLSFDGDKISEVDYKETGPYRLYSGFLKSPDRYLHKLLEDSQMHLLKSDD